MPKSNFRTPILFILVLLVGGGLLGYLDYLIKQNTLQERQARLTSVNKLAKQEIEQGFNNFASFVSGVKAKIDAHDSVPAPEELREYMVSQMENLSTINRIAVSFLDENHIFQFTFTEEKIDPFGLKGLDVRKIRPDYNTKRMDSLMRTGEFFSLYLVNIVEGWVAIPIDFGVIKNEKPLGYMAVLTDFKSIADNIYNEQIEKEFVFHFVTRDGHDVDRERVYDEVSVYNPNEDREFYKNFNVPLSSFVYSNVSFHNIDLKVGTAYKEPYKRSWYVSLLLLGWYATLLLLGMVVIRQTYQARTAAQKIQEQKKHLASTIAAKNKLFAIVAHDLRSPLASILGLTDLLKEEDFKDPEIGEVVNELDLSSKNTLGLLDNLLKWSRVQTGELAFEPEELNLHKLLEESGEVMQAALQRKNIELQIKVAKEMMVKADKNMIATVVRNLINNAVKFSDTGSKIIVSAKESTEKATISVQDFGIGMSQEDRDTLFDVKVRTSKIGTEGEMGTGLGLLLCKEFVETHNGEIWVDSVLGEGTTLHFSLPK